jgi:uncharacterized protein
MKNSVFRFSIMGILVALFFTNSVFASSWDYSQQEDPMTGNKNYYASKQSTNTVNFSFPYNGEQHGTLMLRHKNGVPEVMLSIVKGQFLCGIDGCAVMVRFDEDEPVTLSAGESSSHESTVLFIHSAPDFITRLLTAKRVRIAATVYQEGTPYFEFDVSDFNANQYRPDLKLTNNSTSKTNDSPKTTTETADHLQPNWCKKAKSKAEIIICQDEAGARTAIALDDAWDNYQVLHNAEDIQKMREQLKTWNKSEFQPCENLICVEEVYKKMQSKLDAANKFPANFKSDYPFVGIKGFNFFGGTGTGQTIIISPQGKVKIKSYGTQTLPSDDFEGNYKDMPYTIRGNMIYDLKEVKTIKACDALPKAEKTCSSELF